MYNIYIINICKIIMSLKLFFYLYQGKLKLYQYIINFKNIQGLMNQFLPLILLLFLSKGRINNSTYLNFYKYLSIIYYPSVVSYKLNSF